MRGRLLAAGALISLLVAWPVGAASPGPGASVSPALSPGVPTGGGSTPLPLAVDGKIRDADLLHDSRSDLYRSPTGAVPAGTQVHLRLRAAAGDLEAAQVRVRDRQSGAAAALPMTRVATDPMGGEHGYDYWAATLSTPMTPDILSYSFVVQDGGTRRYLSDDPTLDGGTGMIGRQPPEELGWQLSVYDPAFTTPAWARGTTVYQIFPDRFANGDPGNDPSPMASPGPIGAARYVAGDVYRNPIVARAWTDLPEGYCRAYQGVTCTEQPLGRDFFGGDLAGITAHLDDLAARGITALYLNPIFAAPSNHRYDTSDYFTIDPDLGTQADFHALIAGAHARGIKVILDGVFNHVSSDSPWFDRYRRYPEVGACESADSPYRSWFTFRAPKPGEPAPCAPSTPGGTDTYYDGWAGFDTIPTLTETPGVIDLITGPDGVVRHWLREGIDGWRLDVAGDLSPELLRDIRAAAKAEDPDALVIVEEWGNASRFLLGDQGDSTMDYQFRRSVIGLVNGATADLDGSIEALTPTGFMNRMRAVEEAYPGPAWDAALHLVDSHDTTRLLWTLTPAAEDAASKADPAALAEGKRRQAMVAAIELTFPGMAAIYYGDDVGLSGQDDPDDRRPYPWGAEDAEVLATYRSLALLRRDSPALRDGDLTFLGADDAAGTLAYLRQTDTQAAIVALNLGQEERSIPIDVSGRLPDGTWLERPLEARASAVVVADGVATVDVPARSAVVLLTDDATDLTAPAAPGDIQAVSGPGQVALSWDAVADATSYELWRSLVTGGGYQPVGTAVEPAFVDTGVRNGAPAYYVVRALDAAGNASARSPETVALPHVSIDGVRLLDGDPLVATLSAVDPGPIIEIGVSVTPPPSFAVDSGLLVQVGFGPTDSDAHGPGWTWAAATSGDVAGIWDGSARPEAAGTYDVAGRASSDGGATWVTAASTRVLTVTPGTDTVPPPAPGAPVLTDVADDHVAIKWAPVDSADLYRYVVLRAPSGSSDLAPIGTSIKPVFTDTTVTSGTTYDYAVVAQDTGFNRSTPSPTLSVEAVKRIVSVTFQVTVPADTPATDTLYIAGDFQGWAPGDTPMTSVDASTWAITIPLEDGTAIEYKYTRGSWDAVEKDDGCGEIPNRTLTADFSASSEQVVQDSVSKWRDVDGCG